MIRGLVVAAATAGIAAAIVRTAAVQSWADNDPAKAARLWPGHPAIEQTLALTGIGLSARSGQAADMRAIALLRELAVKQPLSIEPLLVAGVTATTAGDRARAEHLFRIAEQRQGRALAPHYFLADLYLRDGRVEDGLREVANLARLTSGGVTTSAPYLAAFAADPANWPEMRAVMVREPTLADPVLNSLAADPGNLRALLALAGPERLTSEAPWVPVMLDSMIKADRARDARALWARLTGAAPEENSLHDPQFSDTRSPPPFNWQLTASPAGLAERDGAPGLHVIFYGSQSGVLARQLLLLEPGEYRLATRISGRIADPRALAWSIACGDGAKPLASFALPGPGRHEGRFTVPAGCGQQWLSLTGRAQDMGGNSDIRIVRVDLGRGRQP